MGTFTGEPEKAISSGKVINTLAQIDLTKSDAGNRREKEIMLCGGARSQFGAGGRGGMAKCEFAHPPITM